MGIASSTRSRREHVSCSSPCSPKRGLRVLFLAPVYSWHPPCNRAERAQLPNQPPPALPMLLAHCTQTPVLFGTAWLLTGFVVLVPLNNRMANAKTSSSNKALGKTA